MKQLFNRWRWQLKCISLSSSHLYVSYLKTLDGFTSIHVENTMSMSERFLISAYLTRIECKCIGFVVHKRNRKSAGFSLSSQTILISWNFFSVFVIYEPFQCNENVSLRSDSIKQIYAHKKLRMSIFRHLLHVQQKDSSKDLMLKKRAMNCFAIHGSSVEIQTFQRIISIPNWNVVIAFEWQLYCGYTN